ncbi:hypothetical protein [Clostridium weizhouense]|uniref:Uncharacterized protein n=1 Tax=Clostridium weizhouense TaxID=2859781 RepID=A0ABS7AM65_9CLOT|nr:hypothetical protein [Clostridium weizhouense]MBW6408585.1 hypothetical protein [Clostridium weizhouense]
MEFRLNKVDTDLRDKLHEEIKVDKIHENNNIDIKKDIKEDENKEKNNKKLKKLKKRRYITIDGIKIENKTLSIEAEKLEPNFELQNKGRIVDTKK